MTTGWLFRDSRGMRVKMVKFKGGDFPEGEWALVQIDTGRHIIAIGPGPIEDAKYIIDKELGARGFRVLWNFSDMLAEMER